MTVETELTRIEGAKAAMLSTLTAKNVPVPAGTAIEDIADLVDLLPAVPTPDYGKFTYYTEDSISVNGYFTKFDMMSGEEVHIPITDGHALYNTLKTIYGLYSGMYSPKALLSRDAQSSADLGSDGFASFQYDDEGWEYDMQTSYGVYSTAELGIPNYHPQPYSYEEIRLYVTDISGTLATYTCADAGEYNDIMAAQSNPYAVVTVGGVNIIKYGVVGIQFGQYTTAVPANSFKNSAVLKWMTGTDNVLTIGDNAFRTLSHFDNGGNNLSFAGATSIGSYFLARPISLTTDVSFGNSLTTIGDHFMCGRINDDMYYTTYTGDYSGVVTIPSSVTSIGAPFMYNTKITSIVVNTTTVPGTGDTGRREYTLTGYGNKGYGNIVVYGDARSNWISGLPNTTYHSYQVRNLTNGGR